MRAEAEAVVRRGAPDAELAEQRSAFMRYRGQGHEIAVELPVRDFTAADRATIAELFEEAYRRLYSRPIPGVEIEILSWVVALARAGRRRARRRRSRIQPAEPKPQSRRAGVRSGRAANLSTCRSIGGRDLAPGARISGPAVIAEDETSTVVSPIVRRAHRPLRLY